MSRVTTRSPLVLRALGILLAGAAAALPLVPQASASTLPPGGEPAATSSPSPAPGAVAVASPGPESSGPASPAPSGTPAPSGSASPEPAGSASPEPAGSASPDASGPPVPEASGPATPDGSGSALTVRGRGAFAELSVVVSKTRALRNEVVSVSWKGAAPTRGSFGINYLQVFQCWGDAPTGPPREQCQFGGLTGDSRGGAQVASRQVTYDMTDRLETYLPRRTGELRYVPFHSVTGKKTESALSEFFDASTTNEVPFARTRPDGSGVVPFEVQTGPEAPGLGCGAPVARAGATAQGSGGRGCWLVIVPRGSTEVDGSARTEDSTRQLLSSPLSATNWAQRLVVPLDFLPVGQPCPLGRAERPVVGQGQIAEAMSSWQPRLCEGSRPVYSYAQVPDGVARRQAVGDAPGMVYVSRPVDPAAAAAGRTPLYAPVALSGMTVAFQIDSQSAFDAPEDVTSRDGRPVTRLALTPRLVAKLLTQSYRLGAAVQTRPGLERNPLDLTRDPEFLRANPEFQALRYVGIPDIVVPAGQSDGAGLVWQWLLADREAAAFLSGAPDPDGMVVNPAYLRTAAQDGFPKADPACRTFPSGQPPLCTLDAHPYAGDGQEAARAAARGDTLARTTYDATAQPPVYRKTAPQPTGSRAVLALTDTATATRYGLQLAHLRNASGAFVRPDEAGLLAGLAAMRPSAAAGVLAPDPASTAPDAYPLTSLTYALTSPPALDAAQRADYAALLRYAAGDGQQPGTAPGQLPPGYAPLPTALRERTVAAAAVLAAPGAAGTGDGTSSPLPTSTGTDGGLPSGGLLGGPFDPLPAGGALTGLPPADGPAAPGAVPAAGPAAAPPPGTPGAPAPLQLVARGVTPADDLGPQRYGVAAVLALSVLTALAASALSRRGRRVRAVTG